MMEADHLNIRHLALLAAIVERGSVSEAASAINMTQPAATQGIAKLERQLGVALFQRQSGGMMATEASFRLKPRIDAALRLIGNRHATAVQIRAFIALAHTGSYSAAAIANGVTQPSLHRAVSDLGVAFGVRLVERRGRGIFLTRQGSDLARRLRLAFVELRQGLEELKTLRGEEAGSIRVGAMPLCRARLLPRAIADFAMRRPGINVTIHEGSHIELIGPLRDGEIDLMIGALREPDLLQDLHQQALFEDRPTIIARAGHALASGWDADALRAFRWILPPAGTPLRQLWHRMFDDLGGDLPNVPIQCGSVMTIRQLLLSSDYLTLLSAEQVSVELDAGLLIDIGPAPGDITRTIGLTTRSDWRPTSAQREFIAAVETCAINIQS